MSRTISLRQRQAMWDDWAIVAFMLQGKLFPWSEDDEIDFDTTW
jgi:hypothetical protein